MGEGEPRRRDPEIARAGTAQLADSQQRNRVGDDRLAMKRLLTGAFSGVVPILRAVLCLLDKPVPAERYLTIRAVEEALGMNVEILREVAEIKRLDLKMDIGHINDVFFSFYEWLGTLGDIVDKMPAGSL